MPEINARLSQLREAADQFARSGLALSRSAQAVSDVVQELLLLGLPESAAALAPSAQAGQALADALRAFGDRLNGAADDIEQAAQARLPHFDTSLLYRDERRPALFGAPPAPAEAASAVSVLYVSAANVPLLHDLEAAQARLDQQRAALVQLTAQRERANGALLALSNQLQSRGSGVVLETVPEIAALRREIAGYDAQIASTSQAADRLQGEVRGIQDRLARVMPGPGASLPDLRALEAGQSPPWLIENTFDCVRHVVSRMNVPPALAGDAVRWIGAAAKHPEYGVTSGNVPLPGSVLVMQPAHPYADDVYGHVMYVERVEDGIPWVTDDGHPFAAVPLDALTNEIAGPNLTYLYFPWNTRA